MAEFRTEHDTMGEVLVPINALYAAQTQRAVENFPISGSGLEAGQIVALARIKKAAALVNAAPRLPAHPWQGLLLSQRPVSKDLAPADVVH